MKIIHPITNATVKQSRKLAGLIIGALDGRAGIRINGLIVQMGIQSGKRRLYIGAKSIPVNILVNHLTEHEIEEVNNLPQWTGSNEYLISSACLRVVGAAIARYQGANEKLLVPVEVQEDELSECACAACDVNRSRHQWP